jgi:hypothetical protein
VTRPGGRVVLLVPQLPRAVVPGRLRLRDRFRIRLLGTATSIWVFDQTASIGPDSAASVWLQSR